MQIEQAHLLPDQLDPEQFDAVSRLLEVMTVSVPRRLDTAPVDAEKVT